jgi:hypothetical protein
MKTLQEYATLDDKSERRLDINPRGIWLNLYVRLLQFSWSQKFYTR